MRFVHTADWHLGRLFHGQHLTDDQHHVLQQLLQVMRERRPELLIVAGDVYDRAVPPPEAVRLLSEFLREVSLDLRIPVVMVAGNHDSAERLSFGAELFRHQGVHVFGHPSDPCGSLTLSDGHGYVHVYGVPYSEPAQVRQALGDSALTTHQDAMRACVERIRATHPRGQRSVLVGHAFVVGGEGCDSERPLSVGGADQIEARLFEDFDYVALGHLHRPQKLGGGRVRYSGSLLKYSFSEADHRKCVHVVEMDGAGNCTVEDVPLTPRRDVRRVSGRFDELLARPERAGDPNDYLMIELEDEGAILDAAGRLRERFPNVLHIVPKTRQFGSAPAGGPRLDHRRTEDGALFSRFVVDVTGSEITPPQQERFVRVLKLVRDEEREVEA
jgi:DNA repair protein SbcD/Mre11